MHIGGSARLPDQRLLAHIRAIHREVKGEYGWPRIYHELRRRGLRVGKERVRLLMQAHGIRGKIKRRYVATTDSRHALPIAPNLVRRQITATAPDRLWCGDITDLPTEQRGAVFGCGSRSVQSSGRRLESQIPHADLIGQGCLDDGMPAAATCSRADLP